MVFYSDDPVRDAQAYSDELEDRRPAAYCECCSEPLYPGSKAWNVFEGWYCEECAETVFKPETIACDRCGTPVYVEDAWTFDDDHYCEKCARDRFFKTLEGDD